MPVIRGYAAVFHRDGDAGTEYQLEAGIYEGISPTAFRESLQKDAVLALFNHDTNNLLGKTKAGTLRLSVDQRGLRYEILVPDTTAGRDVAASLARGDLDGSSFGFIATKQTFHQERR